METIFDWLALAAFAGLVVLFLQRSMEDEPVDKLYHYAPPAIGCAAANWLGNNGYGLIAVAVLVLCAVYVIKVLRPFPSKH